MLKKIALHEVHIENAGRMVPFAGYVLPVQYSEGVIAEHMATRTTCGLFDVSHMGQFVIKGSDATKSLCDILTADFIDMESGAARYSLMCNEDGGCIDDLVVYKRDENDYLLVVNAANRDVDREHITAHINGDVKFCDVSDDVSQIALQGPLAYDILLKLVDKNDIPTKYYTAKWYVNVAGFECLISRTGYTGEDGFEIYFRNSHAVHIWDAICKVGVPMGMMLCGLGARDTLRLEAGMPLYGHEIDESITPLDAGLSFAVKTEKEQFIGKEAIIRRGSILSRIGIKMVARGIAREGCDVYFGDRIIGKTTSGTHCAYIGYAVAMALVEQGSVSIGDNIEVSIRGKRVAAVVVKLPFYKRKK